MMKHLRASVHVAAAAGVLAGGLLTGTARGQQIYAYPQKGQSQQQQQQDQAECHGWALQQSGYNPASAQAPPPPPPPGGGAARGAARGAAVGAVGGAVGGDAGKGAAAGAAAGAVFGTMRRNQENKQYQAAVSQQQAQASQQQSNYNRAYAACLQGRGYTVQ
jgi:Glycine-zipper domain